MLSPRLTNCPECSDITALIQEIDCKISELSIKLYNSIVFMLSPCNGCDIMGDLLHYRRILTFKYCNPDYASGISVNMIASKIKILKFK